MHVMMMKSCLRAICEHEVAALSWDGREELRMKVDDLMSARNREINLRLLKRGVSDKLGQPRNGQKMPPSLLSEARAITATVYFLEHRAQTYKNVAFHHFLATSGVDTNGDDDDDDGDKVIR